MLSRLIGLLFACFATAGLFGQSFTGQISGLVTDPSGAVSPAQRSSLQIWKETPLRKRYPTTPGCI